MKLRHYEIMFLWDQNEVLLNDQKLEDELASFLAARGIEARRAEGKNNIFNVFSLSNLKKATPQTDSLSGVTAMFNRLRREEWGPVRKHPAEQNKK